MFVYNNFKHDARVLKEARSLVGAGYTVTVVALRDKDSAARERVHGISVVRIQINPVHARILRRFSDLRLRPLALPAAKLLGKKVRQVIARMGAFGYRLVGAVCRALRVDRSRGKGGFTGFDCKVLVLGVAGLAELLMRLCQAVSCTCRTIHDLLRRVVNRSKHCKRAARAVAWIAQRVVLWPVSGTFTFLRRWVGTVGFQTTKRCAGTLSIGLRSGLKWVARRGRMVYHYLRRAARTTLVAGETAGHVLRAFAQNMREFHNQWLRPVRRHLHTATLALIKTALAPFHVQLCLIDFYRQAFKVGMRQGADVYHAHDLNTLPVAYWAARRRGGKLVYDSHELYVERNTLKPPTRLENFLWTRLESFLIHKADAVISVNQSIVDELSRRYDIRRGTVIMNTPSRTHSVADCPLNGNGIRRQLRVASDQHLLLYSGKITFNRGLEKVIESLRFLPDCHLVLMGYGNGAYTEKLQRCAAESGVQSRFSFFGPVAPDDVTTYAAEADLGIAPIENACLSYYYCSPNKLFEYVLAGVPVIASDFPELRRVIHQYNVGCTFDPTNPRDIARAAREVLGRPDRLGSLKENTRAAARHFNWENESKKLIALYERLH